MKIYLNHGLGMAIASTLLAFVLYFLGYHNDVEKTETAQRVAMIAGIAIAIVGLTLAIKARRATVPTHEPFGYGKALGAGTLTAVFSSLFGSILNVLYVVVVNPDMIDVIVDSQIAKMESQGIPDAQIQAAEGMIRMMSGPVAQGIFGLLGGFFFTFIIALIVAAFLKRPATTTPPPLA
jgi:hypothetical protein